MKPRWLYTILFVVVAIAIFAVYRGVIHHTPSPVRVPLQITQLERTTDLPQRLSHLDSVLLSQGLVDVQSVAHRVLVELKYSTEDNFLKEDVYGRLERCYLQPDVVQMVAKAQHILDTTNPGLVLKIFDGVRPKRVQQQMWDLVKNTPAHKYVAIPSYGSLHNYGAAVDCTLSDSLGNDLDMGTAFDSFDSLAQPRYEWYFRERGKLTAEQAANRLLLKTTMKKAGFKPILTEWWHFNAVQIPEARMRYKIVE